RAGRFAPKSARPAPGLSCIWVFKVRVARATFREPFAHRLEFANVWGARLARRHARALAVIGAEAGDCAAVDVRHCEQPAISIIDVVDSSEVVVGGAFGSTIVRAEVVEGRAGGFAQTAYVCWRAVDGFRVEELVHVGTCVERTV